jgi:hypothetical protein
MHSPFRKTRCRCVSTEQLFIEKLFTGAGYLPSGKNQLFPSANHWFREVKYGEYSKIMGFGVKHLPYGVSELEVLEVLSEDSGS